MDQLSLFPSTSLPVLPARIGRAVVEARQSTQILAKASGQLEGYDASLNPYSGCTFSCRYCYAIAFQPTQEKRDHWGEWVAVKENALSLLARRKDLLGKRIYLSSVTDPYQPIEEQVGLTRSILEYLSEPSRQPRLVIQTRSPLVLRDIEILQRFRYLRVNMSVTTDSEDVRKRFEPYCPSIERRLHALHALKKAGIRTGACVSPMLPILDAERFAGRLRALEADVYVAHYFHHSERDFAATTTDIARAIAEEYGWGELAYRRAFSTLRRGLPHLFEGKDGFFPE